MLTTTPYLAPICERAKTAGSWHVDHLLKVFVESIKKRRHSLLLAQGRDPFNPPNYVLFFLTKSIVFMLSQRRCVFTPHPSLSLTVVSYDTRAANSRWWREGVGVVWVSSLELTETVTILTTTILIHDYRLSEAFISEPVHSFLSFTLELHDTRADPTPGCLQRYENKRSNAREKGSLSGL